MRSLGTACRWPRWWPCLVCKRLQSSPSGSLWKEVGLTVCSLPATLGAKRPALVPLRPGPPAVCLPGTSPGRLLPRPQ